MAGDEIGFPALAELDHNGASADDGEMAQVNEADLRQTLPLCEFPLVVWLPPEGEIWLANRAAAEITHRPLSELIGRNVFDFIGPRPDVERSALLFASRGAEGVRGKRQLQRAGESDLPVSFWSRSLELDGMPMVITLIVPEDEVAKLGRDPATPWRDLLPVAVGIANGRGQIVQLSADIYDILGSSADEYIGRDLADLFESNDRSRVRHALQSRSEPFSLQHLNATHTDGSRRDTSLVVAPRKNEHQATFGILGAPRRRASSDRVAELEMHLRRIGAEIRAAGVLQTVDDLPPGKDHPQLQELTTRQWEIVSLLRQGLRVSTIADKLFVSQSTVRNHLSAIFRKFGVHSQAELLELLGRKVPPAAF